MATSVVQATFCSSSDENVSLIDPVNDLMKVKVRPSFLPSFLPVHSSILTEVVSNMEPRLAPSAAVHTCSEPTCPSCGPHHILELDTRGFSQSGSRKEQNTWRSTHLHT